MIQFLCQNIWLVPLYALAGALFSLPWSPGIIRETGPRPAGYISILMTSLAFLHSLVALVGIWGQPPQYLSFDWLHAASLTIPFDLEVSTVNVGASLLITGLNLAAQIYAVGYMEMDWGWARFFSLLALFEAGMCTLVLSNSLFFGYVVLEILTLGTYLIIGLWFNQSLVVTGARDAFLTKRVGDLILLMGVVALLPLAGTWNYTELAEWAKTAQLSPIVIDLLCLSLILGPVAKCAQFPLHLWLDEAMEGPIPASILRNTVIVGTGAWILVKLHPILALSSFASTFMIWIGAATAVGASAIAIAQIDIKRSLSYTVSAYMGLLFIAVATGQGETALILLLTFCVAMALLIMTVGGIIWNNVTQDLTQYGGLWSRRPVSGICYLVGAASLVALPPFGGFWSLAKMTDVLWQTRPELAVVVLVVNALTCFSIVREFCLIFLGETKPMTVRSPEALWLMVVPTTITMGFALHLPILLQQWHLTLKWSELNQLDSIALVISTLIGGIASFYIYTNKSIPKPVGILPQAVRDFFAYDFYTAKLYKLTIVLVIGAVSQVIYWVDKYIVDGFVNLVGLATFFSGQTLKYNVSGQTQFYALSVLLGTILLGFLIAYPLLSGIYLVNGG
jgi:NAD(P)H-quinone oxidoreductase subunit 5